MRWVFILVMAISSVPARSQTRSAIVQAFRDRNTSYVVDHSDFPFSLNAGFESDDTSITTRSELTKKLDDLFRRNAFRSMLKGKVVKDTPTEVILESHTYNNEGEMESESTLTFFFSQE